MTALQGALCRTLQGHGHWVNYLALNTNYVLNTGAFDPAKATIVHADCTLSGVISCISSLWYFITILVVFCFAIAKCHLGRIEFIHVLTYLLTCTFLHLHAILETDLE